MMYGTVSYNGFQIIRTLLPANEIMTFSMINDDLIYRHSDSGAVTIVDCIDPNFINVVHQPGTIIKFPSSIKGSTATLEIGSKDSVSTIFQSIDNSISFTDAVLVSVEGTYMLPPLTRAAVVEGTVEFSYNDNNYVLDSNLNVSIIDSKPTELTITGNGKLVIF